MVDDQVLRVLGKGVHGLLPGVELRLQRQHVLQSGAAVLADVAKRQVAAIFHPIPLRRSWLARKPLRSLF